MDPKLSFTIPSPPEYTAILLGKYEYVFDQGRKLPYGLITHSCGGGASQLGEETRHTLSCAPANRDKYYTYTFGPQELEEVKARAERSGSEHSTGFSSCLNLAILREKFPELVP